MDLIGMLPHPCESVQATKPDNKKDPGKTDVGESHQRIFITVVSNASKLIFKIQKICRPVEGWGTG